jgi:hypothetical protein
MSARRVLGGVVVVALLSTSLGAFPIIGDPTTIYLLKVVENVLSTIQEIELAAQAISQGRIDTLVSGYAFPASVFRDISATIDQVHGIRDEIQQMSCDWQFSIRTGLLRDLNLRPLKLCRPSFQLIWGGSDNHWDADMQEAQDYVGTLTGNMISERVQAEESWRTVFPGMEQATGALRQSPGEANRDEAVALAGAGVVADSNSAMASQALLLDQVEREMDRFEDRKGHDMAEFMLLSTKGDDPLQHPLPRE